MQYIPTNIKISLEWKVMKGVGNEAEDFGRSTVSLFLFNDLNRWAIPCTADYTGEVRAELPETLEEGVYSLELLWVKNDKSINETRCIQRTRKTCVFAIDAEASMPVANESRSIVPPIVAPGATIRMTTVAAPYGYDGLSAYEIAVLRGKTSVSEEEWAAGSGGGGGGTVVDNTTTADRNAALSANQGKVLADRLSAMEAGLDKLLWDNASVNVAGGGLMYAGSSVPVTITVTFDSPTLVAETLILTPPDAQEKRVLGQNTLVYNTNLSGAGDYTFTASAFYKAAYKSGSAVVSLRNKVYCGVGTSVTDVAKAGNALSVRKSAAGTYTKTTNANGQRFYLIVPNDVTRPTVFTMGGAPVAMEVETVAVSGVNCTVYKTGEYDANVTLTIKAE